MKNKELRPSITNYELKEYRPFFTEERWGEIQKIVNNWIHPTLDTGKTFKGLIMNPETGICYVCDEFGKEYEYNKNYKRKKVFEQILTDEEYEKCSQFTFQTFYKENEQRRFDAAKKIPESEWDGAVFHGDDFYLDVWDFKDNWECNNDPEEDPLPDYVYAGTECRTFSPKDLDQMIENILENVGGFDNWEPNNPPIPSYLQEAWNKFCDEYGEKYWEEDKNIVIILDKN